MISIIIPTYNESENLGILFTSINNTLKTKKYEIILVDDDSPDKTWLFANLFKRMYPITVIRRRNKRDLSSAVIEGFNAAKGDIIGVMDADLSHSPEDIPKMIDYIEKCDYDFVIGSRLIKGGRVEVWPLHRKIISLFGRLLAKPLTPIKDVMSGFFFFKKNVIKGIRLKSRGYKICLEIIVRGKYNKVKEVPIIFKQRKFSKSKMDLNVYYLYIIHLISLYLYKLKNMFKQIEKYK